MPKLSPWLSHVAEWGNCQRCPLCKTRRKVVLAKGSIPADVLFIGEAPGESEDVIGVPFIGPAGKLLHSLVDSALTSLDYQPRLCWTNLVACIPKSPETKRKNAEPLPSEIEKCSPRLAGLLAMVKPRLIIAVGTLAEKEIVKRGWDKTYRVVSITHPAALLRMDVSRQGLAVQRCQVNLTDAFATLMEN